MMNIFILFYVLLTFNVTPTLVLADKMLRVVCHPLLALVDPPKLININ